MNTLNKKERKQLAKDHFEAKRLMITLKGYYERIAYRAECEARLTA